MNRRSFARTVGNYNRKRLLFILPFVVVLILGLILGLSVRKPPELPTKTYIKQTQSTSTNVLGASVSNESVGVRIDNVRDESIKDDAGQDAKRVTITVAISNNSARNLEFSPGLNLLVISTDNQSYLPTLKFVSVGQVVGGPIPSGYTRSYDIDFEVQTNTELKSLIYQQVNDSNKLQIDL